MSQLIALLGKRESISIQELLGLVPEDLPQQLRTPEGLRVWLKSYSLFEVSDDLVSLRLCCAPHSPQSPASPEATSTRNTSAEGGSSTQASTPEHGSASSDAEDDSAAVHMRGLPFEAGVADIQEFLGSFCSHLRGPKPIVIILNRSGRPSGLARVQFDSPDMARKACAALHRRVMEVEGARVGARSRYIEVFHASEMSLKANNRLQEAAPNSMAEIGPVSSGEAGAADTEDQAAAEAIIDECRAFMRRSDSDQALLSILGAELSQESRGHMKRHKLGLKQLLAQRPQEFSITGPKGQEGILWHGASAGMDPGVQGRVSRGWEAPNVEAGGSTVTTIELHQLLRSPVRPARGEDWMLAVPQGSAGQGATTAALPASGGAVRPISSFPTPSDWGTPPLQQLGAEPVHQQRPGQLQPGQLQAAPEPFVPGVWHRDFPVAPNHAMPIGSAVPLWETLAHSHHSDGGSGGGSASLWLYDVPCAASPQDVLALCSALNVAECVEDCSCPVHMVTASGNKLSQIAIIEMRGRDEAELARSVLDGQWMEGCKVSASLRAELTGDSKRDSWTRTSQAARCASPDPGSQGRAPSSLRALLSPAVYPKVHQLPPQHCGADGTDESWNALYHFLAGQHTKIMGPPPAAGMEVCAS